MTFILIASAVAIAIMAVIFLCLRTSRVPGVSNFAASALVATFAIMISVSGSFLAQPALVSLLSPTPMILACLLLLSGFRQFVARPPLHPLAVIAVLVAVAAFNTVFTVFHDSIIGRTFVGAGTASVICAIIARTIYRGREEADAPTAFVLFAIICATAVSAFFMIRCLTIATGIDRSSHFIDPTAWNLAVSSIRILMFPAIYLSAILLVQGRTVARLERMLAYDDLTGALSRRAFLEDCARHFDQRRDTAGAGALLFLDLDHFKQINDRHGHAVGDRALRHFVEIASKVLPSRASLGRLGGEEFAVLLPKSTMEAAASTAERIMEAVRETPLDAGRVAVPMTVSAGIAAAQPGMPMDDVLKRADDALYRAKAGGRDRLCLADEATPAASNRNARPHAGERRERRGRIETPRPLVTAS